MNKTAAAIVAFGIIIVAILALSGSGRVEQLAGTGFVDAYQSKSGAVLLDVRTPGEFAAGHLDGAVNVDFENPSFASEIQKLDKAKSYFVYCRSGNRSGQAVSIMKNEGIKEITELKGGIVSNQSSLKLVNAISASSSEYVVDPSDMLDGNSIISGTPPSVLSEQEMNGLIQMREEEKLAHDVYAALGTKWGTRVFSNIAGSEQTHTDAVKVLLEHYGVADPSSDTPAGKFHSSAMQTLYDELTAKGSLSLADALVVGATIEDLDIRDLGRLMKSTDKQDILTTYANLQKGSRNHMRAFVKNITSSGGTYAPQYISQEAYAAIIGGAQERGRI